MYIVPKHIPKIYLVHRNGERWVFKNIKEAATELYRLEFYGKYRYDRHNRWRSTSLITEHFHVEREWDFDIHGYHETSYDYIVRDEFGEIITVDDLHDNRERRKPHRRYRYASYDEKDFRNSPVPYTNGSGSGRCNKNIRTTQEIRETDALKYDEDVLEYDIKIRPNRAAHNIPNGWDDRKRVDWDVKIWKKYRKHQWLEKKE